MSWKVTRRVFERSRSEYSDRLVLLAVADRGRDDSVLAEHGFGRDELAAYANVSVTTYKKSVRSLCEMGELAVFRKVGRGGLTAYGVLAGLDERGVDAVYEVLWTRAAQLGGTHEIMDQTTLREWEKGVTSCPLYTGRKGSHLGGKGSGSDPFFSYVGFFSVSRSKEEGGPGDSRGKAASVTDFDETRRSAYRQLVGLEVYPALAEELVGTLTLDELAIAIRSGQQLRAQGQRSVGGYVVQIARGQRPAPVLTLGLATPPMPPAPKDDEAPVIQQSASAARAAVEAFYTTNPLASPARNLRDLPSQSN